MTIRIAEKDVVQRRAAMSRSLRHLRNGSNVGCDFDSSSVAGGRIIAAHDGSPPQSGYRSWRFRTSVAGLHAQYFENWRQTGKSDIYELVHAYLHLFRHEGAASKPYEVLALHTDPGDGSVHKKGPHIHVVRSEHPLPRCHIPLYLGQTANVTASVTSLHAAMETAIKMIADEVLGAYSRMVA